MEEMWMNLLTKTMEETNMDQAHALTFKKIMSMEWPRSFKANWRFTAEHFDDTDLLKSVLQLLWNAFKRYIDRFIDEHFSALRSKELAIHVFNRAAEHLNSKKFALLRFNLRNTRWRMLVQVILEETEASETFKNEVRDVLAKTETPKAGRKSEGKKTELNTACQNADLSTGNQEAESDIKNQEAESDIKNQEAESDTGNQEAESDTGNQEAESDTRKQVAEWKTRGPKVKLVEKPGMITISDMDLVQQALDTTNMSGGFRKLIEDFVLVRLNGLDQHRVHMEVVRCRFKESSALKDLAFTVLLKASGRLPMSQSALARRFDWWKVVLIRELHKTIMSPEHRSMIELALIQRPCSRSKYQFEEFINHNFSDPEVKVFAARVFARAMNFLPDKYNEAATGEMEYKDLRKSLLSKLHRLTSVKEHQKEIRNVLLKNVFPTDPILVAEYINTHFKSDEVRYLAEQLFEIPSGNRPVKVPRKDVDTDNKRKSNGAPPPSDQEQNASKKLKIDDGEDNSITKTTITIRTISNETPAIKV